MSTDMPPFEWMGKMFAEQMRTFVVEFNGFLSECRADQAETKNSTLLLIQSVKDVLATVKDGKDGVDGKDGRDGIDGKDGQDGEKGEKGDPGEKGDKGEKGEDGIITQKVAAYRDVWKEAEEYELGDFVTWAGSLWHCNSKTQDKPGTSENWTLAVKRGRDGKDGKNGESGPQGKAGPKGDKGDRGFDA